MNKNSNKDFWLWGSFKKEIASSLELKNSSLNDMLIGPAFHPHLTLFGPIKNLEPNQKTNLKNFCNKTKELKLNVDDLEFGNSKYQSIYLTIKNKSNLLDLRKNLMKIVEPIEKQKKYLPHISLYYGRKTIKEKEYATSKIECDFNMIVMSKISYAYVDEDKNLWKIVESFNLKQRFRNYS
jgi:2'-5' RNA ligase